jgi:general secretion pathway protein F
MARFAYTAIDAEGREKRGVIAAADEATARAGLSAKRLFPVQVSPAQPESGNRAERADRVASITGVSRGKLSGRQRLIATRQLATLIDATVPVDEALAMTAAQQDDARAQRILRDVQGGVVEGQRLAEALGLHPRSFPGLFRAAVAGGERAGRLGPTLGQLADYLYKAEKIRQKIITASIYPIALIAVAVSVVCALMIFVVPTLAQQFTSLGQDLPLVTRALIAVSALLTQFWPLLAFAAAATGLGFTMALRQQGFRRAIDRFWLSAPIVGRRVKEINASRFVRAVSLLVGAGAPVLDSVRASRDAVDNRIAKDAIMAMADAIERGEPLSRAMRAAQVFPPMTAYMAASGENAGELPAMLERAADQLDQDVEAFTDGALALLEPAIIVVMGAMVAGIVLAIMLPILELNRMALG